MVDKLMMELSKIEEYTGVSVEKLYEILEKQATIEIIYNIAGIIFLIFLIYLGYLASKYFRSKTKGYYNAEWELALNISITFTVTVAIIALIVIPIAIGDIIQIIVNKPVWMLEYLTGLIK